MEQLANIAARLFGRYNLSFSEAVPAEGWTNSVWLNQGAVLRLATEKGTGRIRRETALAKLLPPEINYPRLIAAGVEDGYEWSLAERIYAPPLRDAWHGLTWDGKLRAVTETLNMTKAVHKKVDAAEAEKFSQTKAWFSNFDKNESLDLIKKYSAQNIFTDEQCATLRKILESFYSQLEKETPVLCHGDITEDNLLWDGGHIVSLIDFENSVIAPPALDLHAIINLAVVSWDDDPPREYKDAVNNFLLPWRKRAGYGELLLGYAVMFRQRILECWLKVPGRRLEDSDAYRKLTRLCDGDGGYMKGFI